LLIGVADYPIGGAFPDVPPAIHNVSRMESILTDSVYGGFSRANCKMLINPQSGEGMRAAVQVTAQQATDVLLVYYVGHGSRSGRELYLTSCSSKPESIETTGLRYATMRELLRATRASIIIVILDCCFSGLAAGLLGATETQLEESDLLPADSDDDYLGDGTDGICILASSGPNQPSRDSDGSEHTAFTGAFFDALTAAPLKGSSTLDLESLFRATKRRMRSADLPHEPLIAKFGGAERVAIVKGGRSGAASVEAIPDPASPKTSRNPAVLSWRTTTVTGQWYEFDVFSEKLAEKIMSRQLLSGGGDDVE
jgi:Caspase domain